jgi:hypothetical protein
METIMRKTNYPWKIALVRAVMASAFLYVPASFAQAQSQKPSAPAASSSIPEEKLDAAAAALVHATSIKESYDNRIAGAATQSAKASLAKEADDEMAKAVIAQGLTVKEYASIMQVAQNDASVREKLLRRAGSIE